ncbi:MAG: hypothetical protein H7Y20_18550 [Bryobacteraceae bacterium]|nr:hypothetical protein [Bryobacteraceae bacterium]
MKRLHTLFSLALSLTLFALQAAGQRVTPDLVEAISQIERSDFRRAADLLAAQTDDPERLFVRGVALTLAEDFEKAVSTLERATKLSPQRSEYNLWLYAAEIMSGIVTDQHAYRIRPQGRPKELVGTPQTRNQPFPQDYGDFIYRFLAIEYSMVIPQGHDLKAPRVRNLLRDAGKKFAEVRWIQPEMAGVNRQRAQQASAAGKPGEALIAILREHDINNPDWHARLCGAFVFLGRFDSARATCTQALQMNPRAVAAWLYRSYAQAQLGAEKKARADFGQVERMDAALAQQTRGNLEKLLAPAVRGRQEPTQALVTFDQAVRAGKPLAELQRFAKDVHLSMNARRLRLDESHADKLAVFEQGMRSNPATAAAYSRYLLEESNIDDRSESVERVNERVAFRQSMNPQAELNKALSLAEQAMRANPRHPGAMITRALALDRLGRTREAEVQIDAAIGVAGSDPAALALYSEYQLAKRDRSYMTAASLRTPVEIDRQTRTEQRSDGAYEVTERTMRNPGGADYGRAGALDRAGDQFSERAKQAFLQAIRLGANFPDGCILQARYDFHNKRQEQAIAGARACAQRFPQSSKAWFTLGRLARYTRQYDLEDDARSRGLNLMETTAASKLRKAWRNILRTDWTAAEAALTEAETLDPSDARIPAYRGIMARERQQSHGYAVQLMKALALEEARLALDESAASAGVSRSPSTLALVLRLRTLLAGKGTDAASLGIYAGAMPHLDRIEEGDGVIDMWASLLPEPRVENPQQQGFYKDGGLRWPPKAADVVAEIHLNYGRALQANGRKEEARKHILAGAKSDGGVGRNAQRALRDPMLAETYLSMAKDSIGAGELREAQDYLLKAMNNGMTSSLQSRFDQIQRELDDAQRRQQQPQPRRKK